jgi:hypothetical protein
MSRARHDDRQGDRPMNPWTAESIQALGPTTDVPTLGSIFDCSPWKAYHMARTGQWEKLGVKIIRLGSKYRVVVPSVLEVLGYVHGANSGDRSRATAGFNHRPRADLKGGDPADSYE